MAIAPPVQETPVTISGIATDSTGATIDGKLVVTLNAPVIELVGGDKHVRYNIPSDPIAIANGVINLSLIPTEETTYNFRLTANDTETRFFLASSGDRWLGSYHQHTDNEWYTGAVQGTGSEQLIRQSVAIDRLVADFDSYVLPDYGDPVDWSDLLSSGISSRNVDSSIAYLKYLLAGDSGFISALSTALVRFKGDYSSSNTYSIGDEVLFNGDKYVYISETPGSAEPSGSDWQQISSTSGAISMVDTDYGPSWDGVVDKPVTADKVHDAIADRAPIDSPTLTGDVIVPDITPESSGKAVNDTTMAAYVAAAIAAAGGGGGGGSDVNIGVAYEQFAVGVDAPTQSASGTYTRNLNTKTGDWGGEMAVNAPNVTLQAGDWLLYGIAHMYNSPTHRLEILQSGTQIGFSFSGYQADNINSRAVSYPDTAIAVIRVSNSVTISMRSRFTVTAGSATPGRAINLAGQPERYAALIALKFG